MLNTSHSPCKRQALKLAKKRAMQKHWGGARVWRQSRAVAAGLCAVIPVEGHGRQHKRGGRDRDSAHERVDRACSSNHNTYSIRPSPKMLQIKQAVYSHPAQSRQ